MAVAPLPIRKNLQKSEWAIELPLISYRTESSPSTTSNDEPRDESRETRIQTKPSNSKNVSPILILVLVLLIAGVAAAIMLAFWLAPSKQIKTTTTTTTTSSSTTSTTSTTTTSTTSETTTTATTTTTSATTTTTTIVTPSVNALWSFDGNTNDQYGIYNAVPYNSPTYVTGYTGQYNTALAFNGSSSQYVVMNSSFVNLTYTSFTVEMWFYPTLLTSADSGLFGQCQAISKDLCLIYIIRNYRAYMAFYSDDTSGVTSICINQWYHVAFVYDYSTSTKSVYLNGLLETSYTSYPYQGMTGDILIGASNNVVTAYFTGYIDQVSLMTRAKSAAEVLMDATLMCYYSFDSSLYVDSGPLSLNASGANLSTASGTGRINSAISFALSSSYFVVGGLTKLGTIGQSYSISLWIKPASVNGGTIVHVSKCNYNCVSDWCLAFIGFTSNGQIAIQSWSVSYTNHLVALTGPFLSTNVWTHIVQTYSSYDGIRLFVNGSLVNQSSTFIYSASGAPDYIYLGSFPWSPCVATNAIAMGQYYGLLDEFYLFTRDLTPSEIYQLANP